MTTPGYVNIRGKTYETVGHRIQRFRADHPDWAIETSILNDDAPTADWAWAEARILDDGVVISMAHAFVHRKSFAEFIEKCETKSVGRALGFLGYGGEEYGDIATAEDVEAAVNPQYAPTAQRAAADAEKIHQEDATHGQAIMESVEAAARPLGATYGEVDGMLNWLNKLSPTNMEPNQLAKLDDWLRSGLANRKLEEWRNTEHAAHWLSGPDDRVPF